MRTSQDWNEVLRSRRLIAGQTARTCLLSYVPQTLQTVCGSFGRRQARFSQMTSVGADVFQCDRRDRVLLRDIRRFGTATDLLLLGTATEPLGESGPARVGRGVRVVGGQVVEALAAAGAQPAAVVPAQRRQRQVEHQRVADERLQIEHVADEVADLVLLGGLLGGRVRPDLSHIDPRPL